MKTYLCPGCGRELEKDQKCPDCGRKARGYNLLGVEIRRQKQRQKLQENHGQNWRLFK